MKIISNNDYQDFISDRNEVRELSKEIIKLKKQNKKLKENFISRYKYVITGEDYGASNIVHLYIDGKDIPIRKSLNFNGSIEGITIEIND
jgi:hypothetical protein